MLFFCGSNYYTFFQDILKCSTPEHEQELLNDVNSDAEKTTEDSQSASTSRKITPKSVHPPPCYHQKGQIY